MEFASHWIDRWTIPNPFVSLLYAELSEWDVNLTDFAFKQDSKNIGETALVISLQKLRTTILVGLESLTFRVANPDWDMADDLITVFDKIRASCEELAKIPVKSQEATLVFHVSPGTERFAEKTKKLVREEVLGSAEFYGVSKRSASNTLLLEKSLKYDDGVFFRLTREFSSSDTFADIAMALLSDEMSALALIGVDELL